MMLVGSPSGGGAVETWGGQATFADDAGSASAAPASSNEQVAIILLQLAGDLLRETHPAVVGMLRYALLEIGEDAR